MACASVIFIELLEINAVCGISYTMITRIAEQLNAIIGRM